MTAAFAMLGNTVVSVAYFGIMYAVLTPLIRARQLRSNRLGTATAAIFFSCAVGHGLHALHAAGMLHGTSGGAAPDGMGLRWYEATVDVITAAIGLYYWSLRRTYGALMQGATLFEDLEQRRRMAELEHRDEMASARAAAERERETQGVMLQAVIANSQSLIYVKDLQGRYLMANAPFEKAFSVRAGDLIGQTNRSN
ncbi:MAG: PAS domain-containing protein [Frankiaceae bacterium]